MVGDSAVTISATDGVYTGTTTVYWVVSPLITVSVVDAEQNAVTAQQNVEGDSVSLQVQSTFPDNTTVMYSVANLRWS